ncbi:MAG TPA: ABC transporter permease [Actinomycetota bacterium]|jgi:ABC-type antimicrobial peptide transport system permease subunit
MFFTYVGRELRRRRRQAVVVALGLALGIGLVVTVSAMSDGVSAAQESVLHSLYGVGTDITVTQAAAPGTGGPARFGLNPADRAQQGERFSRDQILQSPGSATMSADQVSKLSHLSGVSQVSGGVSLIAIHLEGTFPSLPSSGSRLASPAALPSVPPVKVTSYSIEGVDSTRSGVGALTASQITSGRYFSASESNAKVAILDQSYAKQHKLKVGSKITIDGTKYTVIGIATARTGGVSSNVYIPLARAQKLAGLSGKVNRIYVKATSASAIARIKAEIQKALPKATVTTADDLASQVSGSLASASNLSGNLGTWLSASALIAAFAVASLLTIAAVGRRIREFGTLKALGWRTRRVVGQVMGEAVVQGILGGILGIGLGVGGAFLVSKLFPSLKATVGATGAGTTAPGPIGQALQAASHTVTVPLTAPLSASLFALAIGLALAGGILAGLLGGWRAARLRPAEALRRVE